MSHSAAKIFYKLHSIKKAGGFDEGFIACSYPLYKIQLDVLKSTLSNLQNKFFTGFKSFWVTKLQNKN